MNITREELTELKFKLTHQCVRHGEFARFVPAPRGDTSMRETRQPMVYLWVTPVDGGFETLYVGKAGLGVSQRLKQHEGGLRQSSSGQSNMVLIRQLFERQQELLVYARKADSGSILDVKVNLYSAEEEAINERFHPSWNRAQFAGKPRKGKSQEQPATPAPTADARPSPDAESTMLCGDMDFTGVVRGSLVASFYNELDDTHQKQFCQLLQWALGLEATRHADMKVVLSYTGQAPGYNGVPTFLISPMGKGGGAQHGKWVARIPLRSDAEHPLTVTLPAREIAVDLQESEVVRGTGKNYCPLNLADFLKHPSHYTQLK